MDSDTQFIARGNGEILASCSVQFLGANKTSTEKQKFFSSSLFFDGSSYYEAFDPLLWDLSKNWTFDFCANFIKNAGNETFFSQYEDDKNHLSIYRWSKPSRLGVSWVVNGQGRAYECEFDFTAGKWYHIAFVRCGGVLLFFVDGRLIGSEQILTKIKRFGGISLIGANQYNRKIVIGSHAYGYFDEIRLTTKELWTKDFVTSSSAEGYIGTYTESSSTESHSSSSSFSSSSSESSSSASSGTSLGEVKMFEMSPSSETESFGQTVWPENFWEVKGSITKLGLYSICPSSCALLLLKKNKGTGVITIAARRANVYHQGEGDWLWVDIPVCSVKDDELVSVAVAAYSGSSLTLVPGAGQRVHSYITNGVLPSGESCLPPCIGFYAQA